MRGVAGIQLAVIAIVGCDSDPMPSRDIDRGADGGANVGPSVDAEPISTATFPETFASTYCDNIAECCRQAGYDSSACYDRAAQIMAALMAYNTTDWGRVLEPTVAVRCLDAFATGLRACTDHRLAVQIDIACSGLFRPTYITTESPPINVIPRAALGEACIGSCVGDPLVSANCSIGYTADPWALCWTEDGLYCENGICFALPTVGEPCGHISYCGVDTRCQNGTCVSNVPTGGTCYGNDECLSGDYCNSDIHACAPVLANGSACRDNRDCAGRQCELGRCRNWSMATTETCAGQFD
jgi:hypothetical protein